MSKSQRTKGAAYEREVVHILRDAGFDCARNLAQAREGGGDIHFDQFMVECKRRAKIAVYDWLDQATLAAQGKKPLVVARADSRENIVILRLVDFLDIIKDEHGQG